MENHEECQYPNRPYTNGQCDNTDPCDPTNIKDGGACTATQPDTPKQLPKVGSKFSIVEPLVFAIIFVIVVKLITFAYAKAKKNKSKSL